MARILVVDDEENMLRLFQKVLGRENHETFMASSGTEALRLLREQSFDLIISDLMMPLLDGLSLMQAVKKSHPDLPFIVITAYGSIKSAVEAIKGGAFDYLTKPFRNEDILLAIKKALQLKQLQNEVQRLREELKIRDGTKEIIYKSKAMESVLKMVGKVADSQATVLIQGESGTGKELIARALHDLSGRPGPFVAVDCSVLPEPLLQSELFGHVKGAFTGAVKDKKGLFLTADGGTLFLDEIGNISPAVQLNLLRVLQEREIKPVGSVISTRVNVRVVAASNVNLEQAMEKGLFRNDLYYRLAVVIIAVPPLRERSEDIAPLAYHFLETHAKRYHKDLNGISPTVMRGLMNNPWGGNVRELENVIERAVVLTNGPILDENAFSLPRSEEGKHEIPSRGSLKFIKKEAALQEEKNSILKALNASQGNKSRAAKILGISRSSLYNRLKELDLE